MKLQLNSLTDEWRNVNREKRVWVQEFIESIGFSLLLAKQSSPTALRQAFILLDNSNEQFMKSYLGSLKIKKSTINSLNYFELTQKIACNIKGTKQLMKRIFEHHDTRNNLYHSATYTTVSKERFNDYLEDIIELAKKTVHFDLNNKVIPQTAKQNQNQITDTLNKLYSEEEEIQALAYTKMVNMIKDNFRITPGEFAGDIFLSCVPGDTQGAVEGLTTILLGALSREAINGKKALIIELIDSNEENAFHTFFVSYVGDTTWYCFYRCFWSKWGEGDHPSIQQIRRMIQQYSEWIDYKIDRKPKWYYRGAFRLKHDDL